MLKISELSYILKSRQLSHIRILQPLRRGSEQEEVLRPLRRQTSPQTNTTNFASFHIHNASVSHTRLFPYAFIHSLSTY